MRIAIVSDIHGNRTAFEAVLADLQRTAPDMIFHGGDLADGGSSPTEIVDRIRGLGWPGVIGNTDEMLVRPESLAEFASQSPKMKPLFDVIDEMASFTRSALGEDRISWLGALPQTQTHAPIALVHAGPESRWRCPAHNAPDADLESFFGALGQKIAVHGHIHRPYVRNVNELIVVNTGSVSLSYDGDPRASYLLIDGHTPTIRRVDYDIDREVEELRGAGTPHADWIARILKTASFAMP
jgi:predicted phosphodiesterase